MVEPVWATAPALVLRCLAAVYAKSPNASMAALPIMPARRHVSAPPATLVCTVNCVSVPTCISKDVVSAAIYSVSCNRSQSVPTPKRNLTFAVVFEQTFSMGPIITEVKRALPTAVNALASHNGYIGTWTLTKFFHKLSIGERTAFSKSDCNTTITKQSWLFFQVRTSAI